VDLKKVSTQHSFLNGTMFVGVDVSHDGRSRQAFTLDRTCQGKSTVAFVASHDKDFTQYNSYLTFQTKNVEFVTESKTLMVNALNAYKIKNKVFPSTVFVYRDGVGNSQINSFVLEEVKLYREAFTDLNIKPKLQVVVVQKKIAQRFLIPCGKGNCEIPRCDGRQSHHAPWPGTVVDSVITSPHWWDFYIVPTVPPPNTSPRPVRYIVVVDELKMTADDIHGITFQLCFAYQNWPGPIRVPVQVMLADKLAYLFGKFINGKPATNISNKMFYL